jgi:hypothetical protein
VLKKKATCVPSPDDRVPHHNHLKKLDIRG